MHASLEACESNTTTFQTAWYEDEQPTLFCIHELKDTLVSVTLTDTFSPWKID